MSAALAARPAPVRRRRPAGSVVAPTRQRQSPERTPSDRPQLFVVQPVKTRGYSLPTLTIIVVTTVLILVVMFQTVIAEQQLRLDKVTTDVRLARFHYDELRQQRAELRAPDYLREQAMILSMSQGVSAQFTEIPADVVASVLAATGAMDKEISQPPMLEDLASQTLTGVSP